MQLVPTRLVGPVPWVPWRLSDAQGDQSLRHQSGVLKLLGADCPGSRITTIVRTGHRPVCVWLWRKCRSGSRGHSGFSQSSSFCSRPMGHTPSQVSVGSGAQRSGH